MAIHKTDLGVVISSGGAWLPGVYEDERTGRWAFRFHGTVLAALQYRANRRAGGKGGVITRGDLVEAARAARVVVSVGDEA